MCETDVETFNEVRAQLKKAKSEIKKATLEIEVQKQEVKDEIGELLTLLEDFPD